ncbi:protein DETOXIFICATION 16-like [Malania oleifera]|uniref:protein DETOXIFICATION 16-like n=1 Tax=Malania oleifera TaxID=397392 RepID=UPI0025AE0C52|nr:protein DETOXIFICATION 16-like [Malania oleifera]
MEGEGQMVSLRSPMIHIAEENGFGCNGKRRVEKGFKRDEITEEVRRQLWLALPLISVCLLQYLLQIISVMVVGHLGQLPLSGASMANAFASVTGFDFLIGMASALDTLCGQSYGAKHYHMLGVHMQRAMLVLSLVSIPIAVIWANTGSILTAAHQDPDIAREAQVYAQYMIPSLFAYGLLQCLGRFLQTQKSVFPMMISSGITTLLHLPVCWLLVFKLGLGIKGAALANCFSYWVNVLLLVLYVKFSPLCVKTWTGFSRDALRDTFTFLRLAFPSALMVCLEMWSYELMVLLSGLLPNPKLESSVLSISLNTAAAVWMIALGQSSAVSTRVSNELGAGHPEAAQRAVWVVLMMAIAKGIVVGIIMILLRDIWGYAYSNETEVVRYVANMMPILALSNLLDGVQCVLSGIARGSGWQKIGAVINLGSYYIVGIPAAIVLAFVLHIGGRGLWLGIILALIVQVTFFLVITFRTNWEQEASKAKERVCAYEIPVHMQSLK